MPAHPRLSIDPRRFRLSFVAAFVVGQFLIWAGFAVQFVHTRAGAIVAFEQRALADTLVLEDHASRSLDVVAARALLASLPAEGMPPEQISRHLAALAAGAPVIRSLSLADSDGTIRASSDPQAIGARLPPGSLPPPGTRDPAQGLTYGPAIFQPISRAPDATADAKTGVWIATRALQPDASGPRLVVAIDLAIFADLWTRLRDEQATQVALFDLGGICIVAHAPLPAHAAPDGARIVAAARAQGRGLLTAADSGAAIVAFRASANHPFVLTVAAEGAALARAHLETQMPLAIAAMVAALLVTLGLLLLFRWYLCYEASVIEMRNQALAIGEHVMVSETDAEGRIIDVNDAFLRACGYARREVLGQDHRMFKSGDKPPEFFRDMRETLAAGRIWHGTLRNRSKSGQHFWVNTTIIPFKDAWGRTLRHVALYSDITAAVAASESLARERRMRAELSATNRALMTDIHTDQLTGLANRRAVDAFLAEFRAMPDAVGEPISVLMLDIDHFKRVNDGWGHAAGDIVLREAAARWRRALRASDFIARLGGEEFCVLLPRTPAPSALFVAHKLCEAMRGTSFEVPGPDGPARIGVTVSIGIAATRIAPDLDLQTALNQADEALYLAKRHGRNRIEMHGWRGGAPAASGLTTTAA